MHSHTLSRRLSRLAGFLCLLGACMSLPGLAQTPTAPAAAPVAAKALLDRFGYRDRDGDGWREKKAISMRRTRHRS